MLVRAFISGFFIFNSIPHLVKGIAGEKHMTPFKRESSPTLNIIWSFSNMVAGFFVLGFDPLTGGLNALTGYNFWAFVGGGFILALVAAWLFGRPNAKLPWHKD